MGFEPMTSATPVQRSELSCQLGAGHLRVHIPVDGEGMRQMYEIHIFVLQNMQNLYIYSNILS